MDVPGRINVFVGLATYFVLSVDCVIAGESTNRFDSPSYQKVEKLNMMEVIKNETLFYGYISCVIDKAPCNEEGKRAKVIVKDLLETGCDGCSDVLKLKLRSGTVAFRDGWKEEWQLLLQKYDPTGNNRDKLIKFIDEGNK